MSKIDPLNNNTSIFQQDNTFSVLKKNISVPTTYSEEERNAIFKVDIYNNYNDWNVVVSRGPAIMANSLGDRIFEDSSKLMREYYAGDKNSDDVIEYMDKCCDLMIEYQTYVSKDNILSNDDKESIIGTLRNLFSYCSTIAGVGYCNKQGVELNKQYENQSEDFAYYDSDAYYNWKDLGKVLEDAAYKTSSRIIGYKMNFEKYRSIYPDNGFNLEWSYSNALGSRVACIKDNSLEPPKGFKMFFKDNPYLKNNSLNGIINSPLIIWKNGTAKELSIPLVISGAGKADHSDGVMRLSSIKEISSSWNSCSAFFDNFLIFQKTYGVKYYDLHKKILHAQKDS